MGPCPVEPPPLLSNIYLRRFIVGWNALGYSTGTAPPLMLPGPLQAIPFAVRVL